ncbi:MAG: hypothetical protein IGR92_10800 [Leptolyngbyaceae cyanobacterium T60_A2020_046]|nr:hypothetical protein [Leptolyngbyaceae cyanobacterium T60_A2020_046]
MAVRQAQYETLLATCSEYRGALDILKQYRPYLEAIPSMRRPKESIVTIPLPNIRVRQSVQSVSGAGIPISAGEAVPMPCDVALLMCDPEWKIKTGVEIFVFIHRPNEDFSDLLIRWRKTQILLDRGYEWMLPARYHHLLSDEAEITRPLFIVFPQSPERILKGLKGAGLPAIVHATETDDAADASLLHSGDDLHLEDTDDLNLADLDSIGQRDRPRPDSPSDLSEG